MEKPANQGSKPLTTFIQTDTNTFRDVVQRLTGPSDDGDRPTVPQVTEAAAAAANSATLKLKVAGVKKPTFKLHERRQYARSKLEIIKPSFAGSSNMSPSGSGLQYLHTINQPVSSPSKTFSNLSIFQQQEQVEQQEEEKAIKERRFYLHPSPRSRPGNAEPELLPLFPLTSPNNS